MPSASRPAGCLWLPKMDEAALLTSESRKPVTVLVAGGSVDARGNDDEGVEPDAKAENGLFGAFGWFV